MNNHKLFIFIIVCTIGMASVIAVCGANETRTIHDPIGDVAYVDPNTGNETQTNLKPNIDITNVTYSRTGSAVTMTLTVYGSIENRGSFDSYDLVQYVVLLTSSAHEYGLTYVNHSCELSIDMENTTNITTFSASGSTLTFNFDLLQPTETYNSTYALTADYSITSGSAYYDEANDLPLQIQLDEPITGIAGTEVNFIVSPLGGATPYTYQWSFGDGGTSTQELPSHVYSTAGNYSVSVTVTDHDGAVATASGTASISPKTTPPPNHNTGSSNLLLFGIVIIAIIIVGVAVVVYIIRR